jgi:cobyrinic acid a,c-diamide synthase
MIAFMVAGTASGVGKTTVALTLMAMLRERGLRVQPFKCGPDFLDTGHHSAICGRASRNLDTWMLDDEANRAIFSSASRNADVAIVEGMMGLYDGVAGGGEDGSAAQIAKLLDLPVVLVMDAGKSARSIAAVVKGFESFDPAVRFAGIVLNNVGSDRHYRLLETAIRSVTTTPLLGHLPSDPAIAIPERHLGLHTTEETTSAENRLQHLRKRGGSISTLRRCWIFRGRMPRQRAKSSRFRTQNRHACALALRGTRRSRSITRIISICFGRTVRRSWLSVHFHTQGFRRISTGFISAVDIRNFMRNY